MKKLFLILIFFMFVTGLARAEMFPNDLLQFGDSSSSNDKNLIFDVNLGGSNPKINVNTSSPLFNFNKSISITGSIEVTNNIVAGNELKAIGDLVTIGDGTNTDKEFVFDIGSGSSNPRFKWSSTTNALVFNNGIVEKKIGSGSGSGSGVTNLIENASFEDTGSPILNWTNTGGSLTQQSYSNATEENTKYARFVTSNLTDKLESDLVVKPDFFDIGGMADIWYKSTENFHLSVITSTGTVSTTATISASSDWVKAPTQTFAWDANGKLVIEPLVASSTIELDTAYLGSNKGFIPESIINESHFIEWYSSNGDTATNIGTSLSNGIFFIDTYYTKNDGDVVSINTDTDVTRFFCKSEFLYCEISINVAFTNTANFKVIRGSDGQVVGQGSYNSTGWPKSVIADDIKVVGGDFLYAMTVSGAIGTDQGAMTVTAKGIKQLENQTYTPEQANFLIDVSIGGANPSLSNSSGNPIEITNSTLDMVLNRGSAKIPCSLTNASTGLTCSSGDESIGVVFNVTRSGIYKTCFTIAHSSNGTNAFRIVETENNNQTILQTSKTVITGSSSEQNTSRLCGLFDFQTVGEHTLRLFSESNSTGSLIADRSATAYERDVNITVEMVNHNVSRPIVGNQVTTNYKNGIKTVACRINNNGTLTIDSSSGLCDWIDSIQLLSTGNVLVETHSFSKKAICSCRVVNDGAANCGKSLVNDNLYKNDVNKYAFEIFEIYNSGTANQDFEITCIGAR